MRVIRVEGLTYSTVSVVGRTIPLTVNGRTINLRVRRCGEAAEDPIRLSILTSTTQNLPRPRMAEGCDIRTRQIPGGRHVITIEPRASGKLDVMRIAEGPTPRDVPRIWPVIAELLDELLPEYRFE